MLPTGLGGSRTIVDPVRGQVRSPSPVTSAVYTALNTECPRTGWELDARATLGGLRFHRLDQETRVSSLWPCGLKSVGPGPQGGTHRVNCRARDQPKGPQPPLRIPRDPAPPHTAPGKTCSPPPAPTLPTQGPVSTGPRTPPHDPGLRPRTQVAPL